MQHNKFRQKELNQKNYQV